MDNMDEKTRTIRVYEEDYQAFIKIMSEVFKKENPHLWGKSHFKTITLFQFMIGKLKEQRR